MKTFKNMFRALSKLDLSFYRAGFEVNNKELNYYFKTKDFNEDYLQFIWHNARRNLKISLSNSLLFSKIPSQDGKIAYEIISQCCLPWKFFAFE